MDETVIKVAIAVASAIISILSTIAVMSRKAGRDDARLDDLTKDQGKLEGKVDKLAGDVNALGGKLREIRVLLGVAGDTGKFPKWHGRDSGEGPVTP